MPPNSHANNPVTTVILAGGAGRRMDGEDKGLVSFRGRALISYVVEHLAPQSDTILINCNRNHDAYARFGYPLIEDNLPGGQGPLAGLLAALETTQSDYVLSAPCDTPFLPDDLISRMLTTMTEHHADACTVDDGNRLHPVILLVHRRVTPSLRNYLESGKRKVHDWYYSLEHCKADFSDKPEAFININTPAQLQEAEQS